MKRRQALWLLGVSMPGQASPADPLTVIYPLHQGGDDPQLPLMLALLRLGLERSGKPYRLQRARLQMVQGRGLRELAEGSSALDLLWTMSSREREAMLLPVRIPLDKGLLGWRLPLIRSEDAARWRGISDLAALRTLWACQGHDWPDVEILRANGLPVGTSSDYEGLFRMLRAKRVDYFPRSILEIDTELAAHRDMGLAIAPHVLLHYPTASYFFINQRQPQLAADLLRGLELAVADGSFDKLFYAYHGGALARHDLRERLMLELHNPLLPEATPLHRKELWHSP